MCWSSKRPANTWIKGHPSSENQQGRGLLKTQTGILTLGTGNEKNKRSLLINRNTSYQPLCTQGINSSKFIGFLIGFSSIIGGFHNWGYPKMVGLWGKNPNLKCHLRPLAPTAPCGHLRPLAATRVAASGCKWLQVAASGCVFWNSNSARFATSMWSSTLVVWLIVATPTDAEWVETHMGTQLHGVNWRIIHSSPSLYMSYSYIRQLIIVVDY